MARSGRPGDPVHFVKRSPSRSPAKMMSREEAAEMMLRTELRRSASRSSAGGQFEVDAANARADAAERRSFEIEENAALRVAEAEELADAAQDAAVEASTRARMEASLRAELERELAAARGDTAHRAPPEPRVHHPVVAPASTHVDVSIDRSRGVSPSPAKPAEPAEPAPASEDAVAVANRRRMRAELGAEDARARLSAALANLDETRHELETERRRRASVEVKLAAHETRRANAVESLIALANVVAANARFASATARTPRAGAPLSPPNYAADATATPRMQPRRCTAPPPRTRRLLSRRRRPSPPSPTSPV